MTATLRTGWVSTRHAKPPSASMVLVSPATQRQRCICRPNPSSLDVRARKALQVLRLHNCEKIHDQKRVAEFADQACDGFGVPETSGGRSRRGTRFCGNEH